MMFLSPEWIADFAELVSNAEPPPIAAAMIVQQEVSGLGSTIVYHVVLDPERSTVVSGPHPDPTVTFRQSRAIAEAIAQGRTSSHEAFMLGQLEVSGNTQALIDNRDAAAWLEATATSLQEATSY